MLSSNQPVLSRNQPVRRQSSRRRLARRGQALLEFSLIGFLLFTIVIGTLSYGLQLWQAIMLQQAVDGGAIAASRIDLMNRDATFVDALANTQFRSEVYDPKYLVVTDQDILNDPNANNFAEYMRDKPVLNRLLSPAMIFDANNPNDPSDNLHRYPGTLVSYTDFDNVTIEQTVLIPIVVNDAIVRWRYPVEEITALDDTNPTTEHSVFPATLSGPAAGTPSGLATLRINYPYQSATAIAWRQRDSSGNIISANEVGQVEVASNNVIIASDPTGQTLPTSWSTTGDGMDPAFSLVPVDANRLGPFSGNFGLGRVLSGDQVVRPFRQVMTFQAARFREEF